MEIEVRHRPAFAVARVGPAPGETVVAEADAMMATAGRGRLLVFEFTGPGRVWTQSRNPRELVGWLAGRLPFTRK